MHKMQLYICLLVTLLQLGVFPGCTGADTLLPDIQGRLKTVVVSVNSARRSTLRNAELVTNIVNGLPSTTRIFILTNDRTAFSNAGGAWPDQISFIELPADNPITMWTQDPFLVLTGAAEGSGSTTLLASKSFERSGDSIMAGHIAEFADYHLQTSTLYFEGGNIVSDDEYILIGANTIRYNSLKLEQDEVDIVIRFQKELGRPVLVLGPYPQPIAHIDMMITPLGDGRILVADSHAGARIVETAMKNDPEAVEAFERYCEEHFFGHRAITEIQSKSGQILHAPEIRGKTEKMIALSRTIGAALDGVATSLERYGYKVERIPLLYGGPESFKKSTDEVSTLAAYPILTYNNVLITGQDVYLPRFGLKAMDDAALRTWENLGFTTHTIEGLTISAMYGGALRCSVKVLER